MNTSSRGASKTRVKTISCFPGYGIPAFYALHVCAWKQNSPGMFVDWNPTVSCEDYTDGLLKP